MGCKLFYDIFYDIYQQCITFYKGEPSSKVKSTHYFLFYDYRGCKTE